MTERLYYTDSSCRSFDATVTRSFTHQGRAAVTLDRTAFYPTSGGQPFDTGRLEAATVVDVVDGGDDVVHIVDIPLAPGMRVRGEIDWPRRFDHMQQHTGQHVLSAAFDRLLENRTMSFHMGADSSTIDLAREVSASDADRCVDEANRIVWDDRAVSIRFVSPEEAARLPLRKEPGREGALRLVEVEDFDLSACGGTHVTRTGAIGAIEVTAIERLRGGSRMTFVCGARVSRLFRTYREAIAGSVRTLSVLPHELPAAVEKAQLEARHLRKVIGRLQSELAGHEAARLLAGAVRAGGLRVVVEVLDGWDPAGLKAVAAALTANAKVATVLFSPVDPAGVAVARSQDVDIDARRLLQRLLDRFGGRGGGRPDLAQGAGLIGKAEDLLAAARDLFASER